MQEKKYWQSFAELEPNNSLPTDQKEFGDDLPVLEGILEPITDNDTNRRDFLKTLGFTVGAATIAAGCSIPEKKSIPYVNRPEEIAPGIASYYSSVYAQGGDYVSILVKNRDGRPIKIEGNPDSKVTKGGTTALAQASIITLYDSNRHQNPKKAGKDSDWKTVDSEIAAKLSQINAAGGKIAIVSSTIHSPSTNAIIAQFKAKYSNAIHVTHDAMSYSGLIEATEKSFGTKTLPNYNFASADVILSIGADFLATWLSPIEYSKDYILRRKVSKENTNMSKHIHVESVPSASSATADEKFVVSASEEARFIGDLYSALTSGTSSTIPGVNAVKDALLKAKNTGKSILVVNGTNDTNAQILTYAVNSFLGAIGNTVSVGSAVNYKKGTKTELDSFVADLNAGSIKAVLFLDSNPVYSMSNGDTLVEQIKKLDLSVSFSDRIDETSSVCQYICPTNHYLESWNDYEPKQGIYSVGQPVISPLFNTRQAQQSLMVWSGATGSYYDVIRGTAASYNTSGEYANFDGFWAYTIMKGESGNSVMSGSNSFNSSAVNESIAKLQSDYPKSKFEIKFYQTVHGDGSSADNPFIQELPDPVSRMTWGNYFIANPADVKEMGADDILNEKRYAILNVKINGKAVKLPVVSVAGVAPGTLGMKFGFGRTKTSNAEYQYGANAYQFSNNGSNIATKVEVSNSGEYDKLASVQSYFTLNHKGLGGEKTRDLIKETTLAEYKANPEAGNTILGKGRKEWIEHHLITLYPKHESLGHKWGMVIDLNSCVGCGACVVACNIENNVPVVGKNEVHRSHDMHWLRIDRYHTGDVNNPDVTFQPMLCQHCDNAPCENVCPVSATNHSSEGINQMAYNRCIGTRYCANNCPYKVRRFNWFDYQGADAWGSGNDEDPLNRTDSVARMVLNPDVVTRSRGVIEKCSFCTQKIQASKLEAKKESRELRDGDIQTACQSACPTNAIVFGDVNNKNSKAFASSEDERAFGVVEEIYTKPNVTYLTKVRNRDLKKTV
jgi:molybdopterin-containing oxidoreductase family iron-sulfur binding subunit